MALSDKCILEEINNGAITIDPFHWDNLATSSYDVTLGENFYRATCKPFANNIYNIWSKEHTHAHWRLEKAVDAGELFNYPESGIASTDKVILLQPGETILAHTQEFIGGRGHLTTMMKARSSMGRQLIAVCKCAGWGDVGYVNRWAMEITNYSTHHVIPLVVGRRVAQIVFFETGTVLDESYESSGKYQTSADIEEIKRTWTPDKILPKLWKDREIMI